MGAALDYANQNFPDTNPDGSPFSPAVSSIRGLAAVIDNAIPNAQDLAGETSRAEGAESALSGRIVSEVQRAEQAEGGLGARIDGEMTRATGVEAGLASALRQTQADLATEAQTRGGAVTALGARIDGEASRATAAEGQTARGLAAEIARASAAEVQEAETRAAGDKANTDDLASEVTRATGAERTLDGRIDVALSTAADATTALGARLDLRVDGEAEARASDLATLRLLALATDRPGDNPSGFAADPAFPDAALPASMVSVVAPDGRALRMTGAGMLTPVALCPVELGRTVKVRTVVRRVRDTADPAGDAVGLFVAWYTADRVLMATVARVAISALAVADGLRVFGALVSPDLGDASYVRPPAGATYLRPFVQAWGDTAITDVLSLGARPVADVLSPDVDAWVGRLNAVEQRQVAGLAAARSRSFIRAVMFGG